MTPYAQRVRAAAAFYGVSQRRYLAGRSSGELPGMRALAKMGAFDADVLADLGLPPIATRAARPRKPRDLAGQNARANQRAQALGYRGKDEMYRRRREGTPTPADIKSGGATFQRLPGGRLWLRLPLATEEQRAKAEQRIDALLPKLPPTATVAVTVRFQDGTFYRLHTGPGEPAADALQWGLAAFLADNLVGAGAASIGQSGGGTGMPKKKDTPKLPAGALGAAHNDNQPDYSLYDALVSADLVFTP